MFYFWLRNGHGLLQIFIKLPQNRLRGISIDKLAKKFMVI